MATYIKRKGSNGPFHIMTPALKSRVDAGDFVIVSEEELSAAQEKKNAVVAVEKPRFLQRKGKPQGSCVVGWTKALEATGDFIEYFPPTAVAPAPANKEKKVEADLNAPITDETNTPDNDSPGNELSPEAEAEAKRMAAVNREELIIGAIRILDPSKDYTTPQQGDPVPRVKALSDVLGFEVTGVERDQAYEAYKEEQLDITGGGGE